MDFQAKELQGRNTLGYLRSRTFYTSERKYAYSISEKRVACRHIDKPIEIHNSECSKTRKLRFYASVNTG
jgi:hypothetical protein